MNFTYMIYEAERPRSMAEQREADVRAGQLAATVARLGHSLRHPATGKRNARRHARRGGQRPVTATVSCAIPRTQ
jgi:hypothetical protein